MSRLFAILTLCFLSPFAFAQSSASPQAPSDSPPWKHESELSIVTVGGNTTADTYSFKQKTAYSFGESTLIATGSYLDAQATQTDKTTGIQTSTAGRKWDAALRYEFNFTSEVAAFLAHGAESDPAAGYVQRDNTDLGAKYSFIKSEERTIATELGARYSKVYDGMNVEYVNYARLYVEYIQKIAETSSFRFWVEHLPNLKDSDRYLTNAEASVSAAVSSIFSLKTGYLVKYHNLKASTALYEDKRLDSIFTTALVAKF